MAAADVTDAPDVVEERLERARAIWGTDEVVGLFAPSMTDDDGFRTWFARFCRVGNPPAMAAAAFRASLVSDVRAALPLIQIPTLVMQIPTLVMQAADAAVAASRAQGRFVAEHIAGARYVEVPGADLVPYVGDAAGVLEEIESFLAGDRPHVSTDRLLATVLTFTDRGVHRLKGVPDEWLLYAVAT